MYNNNLATTVKSNDLNTIKNNYSIPIFTDEGNSKYHY
jgi:hypothetical protein